MARRPPPRLPHLDRDRRLPPYRRTSRRAQMLRGSTLSPRPFRSPGHSQSSTPCNPALKPRLPVRFFRVFAFSFASPALRFACSDIRSHTLLSGSPILPTYCLFLLVREKLMACLPQAAYL